MQRLNTDTGIFKTGLHEKVCLFNEFKGIYSAYTKEFDGLPKPIVMKTNKYTRLKTNEKTTS